MIFTPLSVGFAVIAIMLAIGYAIYAESESRAEAIVEVPAQYETELIALDKQAIRRAYGSQVQILFQQWMKDGTGQPGRAVRGANQARKAFVASMTALEERARKQEMRSP